jgi:aspartate-semialdehyde dehydrogenase
MQTVAVIGATGAVGSEIVRLLEERDFPVGELSLFASEKSVGKTVWFRKEPLPIRPLSSFEGADLAFFAAGSAVSRAWIPRRLVHRAIDSSSAFRMDPSVPLVIPEINGDLLEDDPPVVASPNCTATILLMPLAPLHRRFQAERIVLSTYQAASGGGYKLIDLLTRESRSELDGRALPPTLPFPYAFNLYPHNSPLQDDGYVEEEHKVREETRKILDAPALRISATCVRVPVMRAHAVSANLSFARPFTLEEAYAALRSMPGLEIFEERAANRFPTPRDASGKAEVLVGRLRIDPTHPHTVELWAVGDQLLKGAALNAVQIGEWAMSRRKRSNK